MSLVTDTEKLARLGKPRRVWAIAACNGPIAQLDSVHSKVAARFSPGDRLIYLGNYLGSTEAAHIVDRLLSFRTYILAAPGIFASDIVYLRGIQEEMWSKLLQIQFAPNPREVLSWMLTRGAGETLLPTAALLKKESARQWAARQKSHDGQTASVRVCGIIQDMKNS